MADSTVLVLKFKQKTTSLSVSVFDPQMEVPCVECKGGSYFFFFLQMILLYFLRTRIRGNLLDIYKIFNRGEKFYLLRVMSIASAEHT